MHLILLTFLPVLIALVSVGVVRRRRDHRRAERAKALRAERLKARRMSIPHVSANLCGSSPEPTAPISRPPPFNPARAGKAPSARESPNPSKYWQPHAH
jgi:hypothetical protein